MGAAFEMQIVSGGTLRLDGGAMFGVVPKSLWERVAPPDEKNRVAMQTNCLLIRAHGKTILVDQRVPGWIPKPDRRP